MSKSHFILSGGMPRLASLPVRENKNIKYFNFLERKSNPKMSRLSSRAWLLGHDCMLFKLKLSMKEHRWPLVYYNSRKWRWMVSNCIHGGREFEFYLRVIYVNDTCFVW